jgi:hypothetical protein
VVLLEDQGVGFKGTYREFRRTGHAFAELAAAGAGASMLRLKLKLMLMLKMCLIES